MITDPDDEQLTFKQLAIIMVVMCLLLSATMAFLIMRPVSVKAVPVVAPAKAPPAKAVFTPAEPTHVSYSATFDPQKDITAWELANILKLLGGEELTQERYEKLDPGVKKHLRLTSTNVLTASGQILSRNDGRQTTQQPPITQQPK